MGYAASKVIASSAENFHVIMTGRSLERVNTAKAEIEATGIRGQLSAMQLDVTNEASIAQAVENVKRTHGRLDVLINNAAVANTDVDIRTRFQLTMEANVLGSMLVSAAFRSALLASDNPYSLYISSGVGSFGLYEKLGKAASVRGFEMYRASKSALNMLILLEMVECENTGIKIFAVCPGLVVSNLRGTDEVSRSGWGMAGDPIVSGELILSIINGARDTDVGKLVHQGGVYPW